MNMTPQSPQALDTVEEATRLFRAGRDKSGEAHANLLTAQVYYTRGKLDRAKEFAEMAQTMFQEVGDRNGMDMVESALQQIAPSAKQQQQQQQQQSAPAREAEEAPTPAVSSAAVQPKGLDPAKVRTMVQKLALDVMGDSEDIDADSPLMDMGMDSLSSVSLRNDLVKEFNVQLTASVMFDYPSIAALTDHIVEKSS